MSKSRGLSAASGAVDALLQSQSLAAALRPHMAKALWADLVGPQVAGVTQVEKVLGGNTLVVRVKNSVWANELTLLKTDILRRMNKALGGQVLTDIRFKASGLAKEGNKTKKETPPLPTTAELAQTPLTPLTEARISNAVGGITDDALRARMRQTLTRAAHVTAWKQREGWQPCARCGALTLPPNDRESPICPVCRALA